MPKSLGLLLGVMVMGIALIATNADAIDDGMLIDSMENDEINMIIGELVAVRVYSMTRVSIADPTIVDIVDADDVSLLLISRSMGKTALFIWDENGKRTIMVNVLTQNLDFVQKRIEKLLESAQIDTINLEINGKEGKVIITGYVNEDRRSQFDKIVAPFSEEIINLSEEEDQASLIQIDMQIAELNTTVSRNIGISWASQGTGDASPTLVFNYAEALPSFDGSPGDWFKIGDFTRQNGLQSIINALIEEGKGRVLSRPKLVVKSGEQAAFLVGGEIPIRTTTASSSGQVQENVTFKSYGVSMNITPKIVRNNKIDIRLNIEVSDVDASVQVGDDVGFTSRNAETSLLLDDGQNVLLAGLIKHNDSETIRKVPFLSSIPLLGTIFTNRSNPVPELDQELVITLVPTILTSQKNLGAPRQEYIDDMFGVKEPIMEEGMDEQPPAVDLSNIPKEMASYVQGLQEKIMGSIAYPSEAQEYGWQGIVKMELLILSDGTLAYALVEESSGYETFDVTALDAAKELAPYEKFPADTELQEISVTIPVVFNFAKN